jgi:beta-glucanase (GH16 family)
MSVPASTMSRFRSNAISFLAVALLLSQCDAKFAGWVDPDTPADKRTLVSYTDNIEYELVMSDEFERTGRTFKDGHDPMWTGIDKADDDQTAQGKKSLQYYNSSHVSTRDGSLVIKTSTEDTKWRGWNPYKKHYETMSRHFKSGMVQSWNKFCYTGGILEVDVQFPGAHDIGGLWPAVWLLGNLGRATYEASTNLMWPWSYDVCDRDLQRAQEISKCDITNHYSLNVHQGRGATEIDVIEVMPGPSTALPIVKNNLRRPYSSMTLQVRHLRLGSYHSLFILTFTMHYLTRLHRGFPRKASVRPPAHSRSGASTGTRI